MVLLLLSLALAAEPEPSEPVAEPVADAIPSTATAADLLALARRRILGGDYEGAHIALDRAGTALGADADAAAYLKAVTWELEGDPAQAIALYDEGLRAWPASRWTHDRTFRKAEALATMGRPDEALALLATLPLDAFDVDDRHKIALVEAITTLDAGRRGRGLRMLRDALAAVPEGSVTFYQAKARATVARQLADDAEALTLRGGPKRVIRRLEERAALVAQIERQVTAVAALDEPEWVLAGMSSLARAYARIGDDLVDAPPPKKLSPDQRALYDAEIYRRAEIVWVKASRYQALALDMADRLDWRSRRVDELRTAHDALVARIEADRGAATDAAAPR